ARGPRRERRRAGVERRQRQPSLPARRPAVHGVDRWQPGRGARVVRQRVGLFLPGPRSDPFHVEVALIGSVPKLSVRQLALAGKRVFLRADFNVPIDTGTVADDTRLRAVLPTIRYCLDAGASIVLASHLGRPRGRPDPQYSLAPVAARLGELLSMSVPLAPDCVGAVTEARAQALALGQVMLLEHPERPLLAILGGAKVSDKLALVEQLLTRVDALAIGGAMAFTFLRAFGHDVGRSLVEPNLVEAARRTLAEGRRRGVRIALPVDAVVAEGLDSARGYAVGIREIPSGLMALDIGPTTAQQFGDLVRSARTVVWNGPMGVFERWPFAEGTLGVATAVAGMHGFAVV